VGILSLGILFALPISSLARRGYTLAKHDFALTVADRLKYQMELDDPYRIVIEQVSFLYSAEAYPGDIYVFGSPLYYYLSQRNPAIPLLGGWFPALPKQWESLLARLQEALPAYIFIGKNCLEGVKEFSPLASSAVDKTIPLIEKSYAVFRSSEAGTWYILMRK